MSDQEHDNFLLQPVEHRGETDEFICARKQSDKNCSQNGLHFRTVDDVFNYLNNLDEETWEEKLPLIPNKAHYLKTVPEQDPGSTIQQTGSSKALTENQYRSDDVGVSRFVSKKKLAIVTVLVLLLLCIIFCTLFVVERNKNRSGDRVPLLRSAPPCPPRWFWYKRKCYYFSEGERNWTSSQDFCCSHDASLATITDEEKDFIHLLKGRDNFWIGLRRSAGQPWKWPNGVNVTLKVFGDGGDCAFLDNEFRAMSSRCRTTFRWMCSKPDASEKPTE